MLLAREVYAWLRHLLNTDPLAKANGVVVEEIPSTFAPQGDTTDGSRTLAIHKIQDGLTPRIEIRFTGIRPQTYFYSKDATTGLLIGFTNQYASIPGDWKSWDCSDFCNWLLLTAQVRLCDSAQALEELATTASTEVLSAKIMPIDDVLTILEAVKRANEKRREGKTEKTMTAKLLDEWIRKKKMGDITDFAHSTIHYFETQQRGKTPDISDDEGSIIKRGIRRSVTWDDIDLLETEITPHGFDIIPLEVLRRNLDVQKVRKIIPPHALEMLMSPAKTGANSSASIARYLGEILACQLREAPLQLNPLRSRVRFGQAAVTAFRKGVAPIAYLEEFEMSDPDETILPWSMLRRNIFAYSYDTLASAKDLPNLILQWLDSSDLLLPLYHREEGDEEALKSALKVQLQNYVDKTLECEPWLRSMMDGMVGVAESQDLLRALQSEFDLWLFDALKPVVERWRLPLSPYAFSTEKRDQKLYDSMYGAWLKFLLEFQQKSKSSLQDKLKETFDAFYETLGEMWNAEVFHDYKPKIPAISKILTAVQDGDVEGLFSLLVEDLEAEAGEACPTELHQQMLVNPYFLNILRELRLQSIQFPLPLMQGNGKKK